MPAGPASSRCTSPFASAAATASSRWRSSTCRPARSTSRSARRGCTTWLLVTLAIVLSAVLLYGIVKRGSDTIAAPGGGPHPPGGRADRAAGGERRPQRARQLGGAAHHDAERARPCAGSAPTCTTGPARCSRWPSCAWTRCARAPRTAVRPRRLSWPRSRRRSREAMTDMRSVAAGLRVPELAPLDVEAVATRAVRDHERRSGARVTLSVDGAPAAVSLPVKIALFRALQEGLSNATRHGGSKAIQVSLAAAARRPSERGAGPGAGRQRRRRRLRSRGAGLDGGPRPGRHPRAGRDPGRYLRRCAPRPRAGTQLRVWWPILGHEEEA